VPSVPPPFGITASPDVMSLDVGAVLWRVHRQDLAATEFNTVLSDDVFGGGRFDGTLADPYPFLYLATDRETALLETLARSIPFNHHGTRLVLRRTIARLRISAVRVIKPLTLISLMTAEDLASAYQDEWLVQADPAEYPQTRRWGNWLRSQEPSAQGIAWPSRRNIGHQAVVLFGDRCPNVIEVIEGSSTDLDTAAGAVWFNKQLARHRIRVRPPSPPRGAA
jgi:hypothetical protein